jgi:hypothetical protein
MSASTLGIRVQKAMQGTSLTNIRTGVLKDEDGWQAIVDFCFANGTTLREFVAPAGSTSFASEVQADAAARKVARTIREAWTQSFTTA